MTRDIHVASFVSRLSPLLSLWHRGDPRNKAIV